MIFLPPVLPPISLGRFKDSDARNICARCTQFNHPYVGITALRPLQNPGLLWATNSKRAQVKCIPG